MEWINEWIYKNLNEQLNLWMKSGALIVNNSTIKIKDKLRCAFQKQVLQSSTFFFWKSQFVPSSTFWFWIWGDELNKGIHDIQHNLPEVQTPSKVGRSERLPMEDFKESLTKEVPYFPLPNISAYFLLFPFINTWI